MEGSVPCAAAPYKCILLRLLNAVLGTKDERAFVAIVTYSFWHVCACISIQQTSNDLPLPWVLPSYSFSLITIDYIYDFIV